MYCQYSEKYFSIVKTYRYVSTGINIVVNTFINYNIFLQFISLDNANGFCFFFKKKKEKAICIILLLVITTNFLSRNYCNTITDNIDKIIIFHERRRYVINFFFFFFKKIEYKNILLKIKKIVIPGKNLIIFVFFSQIFCRLILYINYNEEEKYKFIRNNFNLYSFITHYFNYVKILQYYIKCYIFII